jgi:hypothetical protein
LSKLDAIASIEINCCTCNLPVIFENMLLCDLCGRWYHQSCAGIQPKDSQSFEWTCMMCT